MFMNSSVLFGGGWFCSYGVGGSHKLLKGDCGKSVQRATAVPPFYLDQQLASQLRV